MSKDTLIGLAGFLMFAFLAVMLSAAWKAHTCSYASAQRSMEAEESSVACWITIALSGLSCQLWLVVFLFLEMRP